MKFSLLLVCALCLAMVTSKAEETISLKKVVLKEMIKDVPELAAREASETRLIEFLKEKLDKMVFFLDDMANATYISE
jgi:hypothetical protein